MSASIRSLAGRMVLATTIVASGITFIYGTAITVAIPVLQAAFDTSLTNVQWLLNAYTLFLTVLVLISGSLSDRFGRKRLFGYGLILFGLGALLSVFSASIEFLIAMQALMGVGAALMIPSSLSIIRVSFSEAEQGRAIGLWSGYSAAIGALGPVIGGVLVAWLGWQGIYLALVPLCALTYLLSLRYIEESTGEVTGTIDWLGAGLLATILTGLTYGLISISATVRNIPLEIAGYALAVLALIVFIAVERRAENPIIPIQIFLQKIIVGATILTLFLYFALSGIFLFLALNFQQLQGFNPSQTGLAILPPIVLVALFSGLSGKWGDRIGPRIPITLGALLVAIGIFTFAFAGIGTNYFMAFLPGLLLFGFGIMMVVPSLTKAALSVEQNYAGAASGVSNAASRFASLMAVAVLGSLAVVTFGAELESRAMAENLSTETTALLVEQSDRFGAIELPESMTLLDQQIAETMIADAFLHTFNFIMYLCAFLALIGSIIAWLFIRPRSTPVTE